MQFDRISRARALAPRALTIAVAAALGTLLAGCAVGPDYKRPAAEIPASYKEAAPGWKVAQPADQQDRGDWWTLYEDPQLNTLEDKLNTSNQTIAQFAAAYRQARALVSEARSAYFPTVGASIGATRSGNGSSSNGTPTSVSSRSGVSNSYNVQLDASWEPDLWGSVTRSVNAQKAG
ncbi:MAG TPA: TolC family protein, partial [Paraburkholderia sp.]|nr:TolC family protein [Paraburkholderia sp.]